jgi:hypothetical protein
LQSIYSTNRIEQIEAFSGNRVIPSAPL